MNDIPTGSYTPDSNKPSVLRQWNLGNLEGRLLTLVEAFGFEEKREEATKSLVRNTLWNWYQDNLFHIEYEKVSKFEELLTELFPYQGVQASSNLKVKSKK